jgi:hypothetical protein
MMDCQSVGENEGRQRTAHAQEEDSAGSVPFLIANCTRLMMIENGETRQ